MSLKTYKWTKVDSGSGFKFNRNLEIWGDINACELEGN